METWDNLPDATTINGQWEHGKVANEPVKMFG
jgi:hypothetical protein